MAAAAIVAALALQTTLSGVLFSGPASPDLVLIVVVYIALTGGRVAGLLAGSAAGLVQDALSSGIIGIGGLTNTVVAFLAGAAGTQFIVTAPFPRFVVFVVATLLHAVIFMGLYVLLDLRQFPAPYAAVLGQALGNGFVGVIGFQVIEWLPGFLARRRAIRTLKR